MALSGTISKNVGSYWRLQLEWSATQNISANTSTVTAKLYWIATSSYGAVTSSATKTCAIKIGGSAWNTKSTAGMGSLKANEKKLIHTFSQVVTHNSDGTASIYFDAYFDAELTLSGTYYGRIDLDQKTFTLNTIPRASILTSSPSWTAGNPLTISVSRASSSFLHDITIKVNGVVIKYLYNVATSTTVNFTDTENANIFKELAKDTVNWNQATTIDVKTKNGTAIVGTKSYTGTCSSPVASTQTHTGNFDIGESVGIGISRANSKFTHTVRVYLGSTLITTKTGVTTAVTWTPTQEEINAMYNTVPNSISITSKIQVDTFFNGVQVRSTTTKSGTARVANSNPTFTGTEITYSDSNSVTATLTGDTTKIIQNASTIRVTLPVASKAVAINGATMQSYIATLGGQQVSTAYSESDLYFDFNTIDSSVDQTLTIKAVDSRGNSAQVTKTVTMIPYVAPKLNANAKRKNGFDIATVLSANGEIAPITVNGVQKNRVLEVKYRHKKVSETNPITWNVWTTFTYSTTGQLFKATNKTIDLDNGSSHNVEFMVRDSLSSKSYAMVVSAGKPVFFIDSIKNSIGVGKFPTQNNEIAIDGTVNATNVNTNVVNTTNVNTNGIETAYLNINFENDLGSDTVNGGLRVGSQTGVNIKMDGNEILACTGTTPSNLHIQSEGGKVVMFQNAGTETLTFEDGYIRTENYIYPSLGNGWVNYSGTTGYQRCSYWKDKMNVVHITGLIKSGSNSGTVPVFTLPVGYRPLNQQILFVPTASNLSSTIKAPPARVDILTNGQVLIQSNADSGWTSLSNIHFKAEIS